VTGLEPRVGGWTVQAGDRKVAVERVVLACPAYVAAELLRPVNPAMARDLAAIDYSPVAVVGLGYRGIDHPLDGFGLLTTSSAKLPILGVLWDSSIFPDRAPAGGQTLRVMIGGLRNPELALQPDEQLVETALAGIETTMGARNAPVVSYVRRWERGIPSYRPGHLDRVAGIYTAAARLPGLYLTSNAYRGIALNDCCANALTCAEALAGGRTQEAR